MRPILIACALAVLAAPALAAPVQIAPATASPKFQTKLEREIGAKELTVLSDYARHRLTRELTARGAQVGAPGGITISIVVHDATPNKPTFAQLQKTPGLSYGLSFGLGGADLEATITNAAGASQTVRYKWYETDITQSFAVWTWSDAHRAIRRFAVDVAKAYVAAAPAAPAAQS
jgi:hypothetical protein